LGSKPEVTLLILNHEDWNKHTSFPVYGMAHYTDQKTLVVASSDNAFWKSKYREIAEQHPVNYGWYQCRLQNAAKNIYDAGGTASLQLLWKALQKEQQPLTDEEFAGLLSNHVHSSVADVMQKWDVDVDR
jgi:hypothetical protein